jgi:S-adenosylmethionine decarboxylase
VSAGFNHLIADFIGVPPRQLRDAALIQGLLIAAAGAAGLTAIGAPIVRPLPNEGIGALLLLEGCHIAVHTFPERELLMVDILLLATHDCKKAFDVFARRLVAQEIRSETRPRG